MENELIKRFLEVRDHFGYTQGKMGGLLGLSDGQISRIESGETKISEKHIKLICGALGINEDWLRKGEGPILADEIPGQKQLLEAFRQLSPDGRKAAIKIIEALLESEIERAWENGIGGRTPSGEMDTDEYRSI